MQYLRVTFWIKVLCFWFICIFCKHSYQNEYIIRWCSSRLRKLILSRVNARIKKIWRVCLFYYIFSAFMYLIVVNFNFCKIYFIKFLTYFSIFSILQCFYESKCINLSNNFWHSNVRLFFRKKSFNPRWDVLEKWRARCFRNSHRKKILDASIFKSILLVQSRVLRFHTFRVPRTP